jgi:cell division protein FtsQ
LLVAAIRRQNNALCKGVRITIEGSGKWMVDSAELRDILTDQHTRVLVGMPAENISTRRLEKKISASPWVRKAELFFDSKQVLWVKVTEREPVARLFTDGGQSFYMDTSGARLPLKDYFPVKLPVFTSCPLDKKVWTHSDSLLARQVGVLSQYLSGHPFWMEMVQQVDVTPEGGFELVPTIGGQVIRLGDTSALDSKFNRLMVFYREVLPRVGWNKYTALDVRFARQVIGIRKDVHTQTTDTAKAAALLRELIDQGRTAMKDTVVKATSVPRNITPDIDSTIDLVPSDGEQTGGPAATAAGAAVKAGRTVKAGSRPKAGPAAKAASGTKPRPKAVMPPKKSRK